MNEVVHADPPNGQRSPYYPRKHLLLVTVLYRSVVAVALRIWYWQESLAMDECYIALISR
ncbi:hypothetical protein O9929_12725 [Vibrio lentus]|nr:hypothetical protein [Vibrio lentus]